MKKITTSLLFLVLGTMIINAQYLPKPPCTTMQGNALFGKVDTVKARGVIDNYHTWQNGAVITVKFMPGGSLQFRNKAMNFAKVWELYANITFNFLGDDAEDADIRIKLGKGLGHNSAVGTEANFRAASQQTINFDTMAFHDIDYYVGRLRGKGIKTQLTWDDVYAEIALDPGHINSREMGRVVMHEFGHALGLLHEQSYPEAIKWNKSDSAYDYYKRTQGWDRAMVDFNVFNASGQFYTNGTKYDPKSIMHYAVEPWQTTDGYSLKDNYELSDGDKALIAALYPKNQKVSNLEVPKIDISKFIKVDAYTDAVRKALVIKPTFDLKTNDRLGVVYYVARLVDETGKNYILTDADYYNWGGTIATYGKANLLPNTKVSYNKAGKNNLELLLPYDYMAGLEGKKIIVEFSVYLDDVLNNQYKKLMYYSASRPLSITK